MPVRPPGSQPDDLPGYGEVTVVQGPTGDDAVVGEDDKCRDHSEPTKSHPAAPVVGECPESADGRSLRRPTQQDLGGHHRQAHQRDAQEIDEDERASPVNPRDVGKLPDVTESDGGPRRRQNEPEFRTQ